ncbi:ExbD/TolR family protein [Flavobacterium sp.]|uniref:ExbD/TolR family protein n=1 Tax=Flavobacterium sp. TaxID=239 RepID=UPI00391D7BCF
MEENNYSSRIVKEKFKTKKLKPRIDLAAMVSVSFLLIIFFMVTVELARPQAMDLGLPEGGCGPDDGITSCGVWPTRVITLLLDDDDKIISYRGLLEYPEEKPKKIGYGKHGIRKELIRSNKQILQVTGDNDRGAIVIIKPSKNCNYGNLIDILDEMAINKIGTYVIVNDYTPDEVKLLASK